MGVHSLWDIVGPAARPVKLEALSRKRLAVDASIWIYQFMKAVRDKEGNSLGQTHIVGFFRRICKMLFFGILPLFVFDGGAPPLKRQVIQARKERRQGNQENASNTAQKLLAMQMHRKAGVSASGKKNEERKSEKKSTTPADTNNIYFDDLPMYHGEKAVSQPLAPEGQPSTFRRKDEYHLPELKHFTVREGDQRIMPDGELEEYGEDHSWDVVDGISIDSVDPSSAEFAELPMATQYMILSHLRLRSRLRLGYSKDQLEDLFPNSRDFSKFQIQQVQKRNYYTQKLMTVSGMGEETGNITRRIAGDKDRQYMLVKNDGGWTLSLGNTDNGKAIELIDEEDGESPKVQMSVKKEEINESDESGDDLLEDVPLDKVSSSPKADTTGHERPFSSDDESTNKAIIESIYDQFEHEFSDHVRAHKSNDSEIQKRIEGLRDLDMKKAVEESKKDYFHQVRKEEILAQEVVRGKPEFEFQQSLLFGAPEGRSGLDFITDTTSNTPIEQAIDSSSESSLKDKKELDSEPELKRDNTVPSWFNDSSHLQSPHNSIGFLSEKSENRVVDENEKAGLIPWNEAKQYFEKTREDNSPICDDSDKEASGSDVEIVENVHIDQPGIISKDVSANVENLAQDQELEILHVKPKPKEGLRPKKIDPRKVFVSASRHSSRKPRKNTTVPAATSKRSVIQTPGVYEIQHSSSSSENQKQDASNVSTKSQRGKGNKSNVLDYDFDEIEEEELVKQLRDEEQEHAQFTSRIQLEKIPIHTKVSNEQLLQEQLQKAKRDAEEVTQTMINDVQELLKRFGIPYITAPMEAEAQCAELFQLGLVDGIVTDDSDCFLFGGSRIYKNMFNQKQYVECYIAEDIEHKVGLDQRKLIDLALLLGSDYTEGIKGIGPVLAMEILAEFGDLSALKRWFDEATKSLKKSDQNYTKLEKTLISRIKNGKLFLPDSFPDEIVVDAYKRPEVDHDKSEFKWGVPSLDQIRSFLMYNVGWSQVKVDEVMVPLIRNINKSQTEGQQSTIGEFFPQEYISYKKDVGMGKRMKAAAERMRGE